MNIENEIARLEKLKIEAAEREDFSAASNYKKQLILLNEKLKQEKQKTIVNDNETNINSVETKNWISRRPTVLQKEELKSFRYSTREKLKKVQGLEPSIIIFKIIVSIGDISSVVNLKLDINNTTVESLIDKILKRFPKDSYKYNLYITIKDKEVKLDELKKLYEFQSLLEEANYLLLLKKSDDNNVPLEKQQSQKFSEKFSNKLGLRLRATTVNEEKNSTLSKEQEILEIIKKGNKEKLQNIIKQDTKILQYKDSYDQSLLHYACFTDNIDIVQLLIKNKLDVNAKDSKKITPLHCSSMRGNFKILEILLKEGGDATAVTEDGFTIFHYLSSYWDDELTLKLFEFIFKKENPNILNIANKEKETALHKAVTYQNFEYVKLLVQYKVDLNVKNLKEETCLHIAAALGNKEIVKFLLDSGVDFTIISKDGTAKRIAETMNYQDIANIIPNSKKIERRSISFSEIKEPALQMKLEYEKEISQRKIVEETLQLVKKALQKEIESHANTVKEFQDITLKLNEEKQKRTILEKELADQKKNFQILKEVLETDGKSKNDLVVKISEYQEKCQNFQKEVDLYQRQLSEKSKILIEKQQLELKLEKLKEDFIKEQSLRTKIEKLLEEKTRECEQLQIEISNIKNQQSNFIEPSIKKKSEELHELYCKELKYRISLSLCRDWSNYSPYISPEIINKIGIQEKDPKKFDQLFFEWQQSKLKEIQNKLFTPEQEIILLSLNRIFIRSNCLNSLTNEGNSISYWLFLFNDFLLIANLNDNNQFFLCGIFPLELCNVNLIADNTSKYPFEIIRADTKLKFILFTNSYTESSKWINDINACKNSLPPIQEEEKKKTLGAKKLKDFFKYSTNTEKLKMKENFNSIIKQIENNDPYLAKVNISKFFIRSKGIISLANALQNNLNVTHLILSHNSIDDKGIIALSNILKDNYTICSLILDNNYIHPLGAKAISELLSSKTPLTELNLSDNQIGDEGGKFIIGVLKANNVLKILDLSNNQLSDNCSSYFYESIMYNYTLSEINLDKNLFTSKTESILLESMRKSFCSAIISIKLRFSIFKNEIDSELNFHKERKERNLCSNLKNISNFISNDTIDFGYFNIKFSLQINFPSYIKTLYLDNCELHEIPSQIKVLSQLEVLILLNNKISILPDFLFKITSLQILNLNNNFLSEIPKEISSLKKLNELYLGCNCLESICDEIFSLPNLIKLILFKNKINTLPSLIFTMESLKELHLEFNPLPKVLQEVYKAWISKPTELDLSSMNLEVLPLQIGKINSLTILKLQNNKLTFIPPQIKNLVNLKILDIRDNPINELPWQLEKLPCLEKIECNGNLKEYCSEITLLKTYLQNLKDKKFLPFRKLKLMLVGRENVGKTSLRKCLVSKHMKTGHKSKHQKGSNISTDGIEIENWGLTEDEKGIKINPITFNIWDFGGQEVYYITHQFFIHERSIYLVVFNLKDKVENIDKIDYWIQSINSRTSNSSIILVGTHADEVLASLLEEIHQYITNKYLANFSNIKHFLSVSCKTRKGISLLQETLIKLATQENYLNQSYPAGFHQLEELLISQRTLRTPPIISMKEFQDFCESCDINNKENQCIQVAQLMNDLGTIVFFNDPKFGLNDLIILDPQWLTKLMSTLITTKPNFVKNGILLHSNLNQIWKYPDFPSVLHSTLLSLLEKFEISFPLPPIVHDKNQKYFIPCLVTSEKPENINLPTTNYISRVYRFDFLPFGFFHRLIVRIKYFMKPITYWKNGILFNSEDDDVQALLEFLIITGDILQLTIEINGNNNAKYMRLLIETINLLLFGWYNVNFNVFIPCNCQRCLLLPINKRSFFTLEECESAAALDKKNLICKILVKENEISFNQNEIEVNLETLAPDIVLADLKSYKINFKDLQLKELVGKGSFGQVYKATYFNEIVAVKKFHEMELEGMIGIYKAFIKEVWLSSTLSHPNIIQLKGCCITPHCCVIMEYASYGNLKDFLGKHENNISWNFKLAIALNIANALKFLHSRVPKIIHRDLKTPNVLMVSINENLPVVCKLTDFGESIMVATKALGRDKLGNPVWCAPEIMKEEDYTEKADIFSVGIILWEIYTRKLPYSEYEISKSRFIHTFEDAIIKGLRPTIPNDCPQDYSQLIQDCWQNDPNLRPSSKEVFESLVKLKPLHSTKSSQRPLPIPQKKVLSLPTLSEKNISLNKSQISKIPMKNVSQTPPPQIRRVTEPNRINK